MKTIFLYSTPHKSHEILANSIKAEYLSNKRTGIYKTPFIGKILKSIQIQSKIPDCDVIYCESVSSDLLAGALYKFFHPKTKILSLVVDPKVTLLKNSFYLDKKLTYWSLKKSDLLLPCTTMMKNYIPEEFHYKSKIFSPATEISKYEKYNTKFENNNLVFIGLLSKFKGIDILTKYFEYYKRRVLFSKKKLYIIGDGELINSSNFKDIEFLGRKKSPVTEQHEYANIYVNLSRLEPSGVAIMENMAMGLVPIVGEGVGYKEVIKKISPELIVKNKWEFKRILQKLNNKELWESYSKQAKEIAIKYNEEKSIKEFKKAFGWMLLQ